jgi:hypothetical protein
VNQKKLLYGFINKNGEVVIKPQFDFCSHFKEGSALVFSGNFLNHRPIGYIDKTGKMVIKVPENCFSAYNFSEGLARFEIMNPKYKHLFGYIDTSGEIVITPKLKGAYDFSEGLALVCKESGWCFIDKSGETVIESFFEEAESFSEGFANVLINGKWGYIDKAGELIIEPQFTSAKTIFRRNGYYWKTPR